MTDPAPVEPPVESTQTEAELNRAIIDASREVIAAQRARPRDPQRIDEAYDEYRALMDLRAELYG